MKTAHRVGKSLGYEEDRALGYLLRTIGIFYFNTGRTETVKFVTKYKFSFYSTGFNSDKFKSDGLHETKTRVVATFRMYTDI